MKNRSGIDEERTWSVYVHVNKSNGKRYVGITSKRNLNARWRGGRGYTGSPHFMYAIEHYGWDGFEHIVLKKELTKREACDLEIMLISAWNTRDPDFGYNCYYGGNAGSFGTKVSEESRLKRSGVNNTASKPVICLNTMKEYPCLREARKDYNIGNSCEIGACCNGLYQYAGKDESGTPLRWIWKSEYEKLSDTEKATLFNKHIRITNSRQIICLNTGKVYDSIRKAAADVGANETVLSKHLKAVRYGQAGHKRQGAGRDRETNELLRWMYYEDYLNGGVHNA